MKILRIQIPSVRTIGTRTRATQMLTYKFVEIRPTPLTTAPRLVYFLRELIFVDLSYLDFQILRGNSFLRIASKSAKSAKIDSRGNEFP